jgi:hypothetical protein
MGHGTTWVAIGTATGTAAGTTAAARGRVKMKTNGSRTSSPTIPARMNGMIFNSAEHALTLTFRENCLTIPPLFP